jgi:hypothetical protein
MLHYFILIYNDNVFYSCAYEYCIQHNKKINIDKNNKYFSSFIFSKNELGRLITRIVIRIMFYCEKQVKYKSLCDNVSLNKYDQKYIKQIIKHSFLIINYLIGNDDVYITNDSQITKNNKLYLNVIMNYTLNLQTNKHVSDNGNYNKVLEITNNINKYYHDYYVFKLNENDMIIKVKESLCDIIVLITNEMNNEYENLLALNMYYSFSKIFYIISNNDNTINNNNQFHLLIQSYFEYMYIFVNKCNDNALIMFSTFIMNALLQIPVIYSDKVFSFYKHCSEVIIKHNTVITSSHKIIKSLYNYLLLLKTREKEIINQIQQFRNLNDSFDETFKLENILFSYLNIMNNLVVKIRQKTISQIEQIYRKSLSILNDILQQFIQNNNNLNNTNNKHEFQLSKIPFLEVSFDYLVNYYIINAKNKDNFYTYFLILFEAFKEMNNLDSHSNKKDLLNINYIRQKIFFENINWCFSSNLNRDNLVKPNYKKYNENKMFPNFYIDKETYGLLLSYEQNLNEDQYTINIRTAVSNIQYSITQNILSSNNEIRDLNNYVISSLSQIHSKVSLQKINIDDEFISLLNSLDTLSIYRNIHCKIFFRNVSLLNGKFQVIENPLISEDFISFLNALGVLNKRSSTNEKIIVTSYDINNKIQYEYMETNQLIASKIENKVTIIWCTTTEIHLNNELISSVKDDNEFYIIVYPVSNSHFLVKIENALNINIDIFNKLFQNETVIYIGEKYEVLAEYVSKMVLILNLFSKFNVLNAKQKNAKNEKISDSLEDILHNHDTLFQRCLKIYTIANKYKKSK